MPTGLWRQHLRARVRDCSWLSWCCLAPSSTRPEQSPESVSDRCGVGIWPRERQLQDHERHTQTPVAAAWWGTVGPTSPCVLSSHQLLRLLQCLANVNLLCCRPPNGGELFGWRCSTPNCPTLNKTYSCLSYLSKVATQWTLAFSSCIMASALARITAASSGHPWSIRSLAISR